MRFQRTPAFEGDIRRLSKEERGLFDKAFKKFASAADAFVASPGRARWPGSLRVKPVHGAAGIWEMTWSFAGPDGRATFECSRVDDQPAILLRRLGDHSIFENP